MTKILGKYEYSFCKRLNYPKEDTDRHTHAELKIIFPDICDLRQSCNLVVNTNKLPVCTFLYFFVLRYFECKITMFSL